MGAELRRRLSEHQGKMMGVLRSNSQPYIYFKQNLSLNLELGKQPASSYNPLGLCPSTSLELHLTVTWLLGSKLALYGYAASKQH